MTSRVPALRIAASRAGVVRCEPQWSWSPPPATFVDFDLWFVWAGRGAFGIDGADVPVRAGSVFCLRPGGTYHGRHDPHDPLGVTYVHFDFVDPRTGAVRRPLPDELPPLRAELGDVAFYDALLRQTVHLAHAGERGDALATEQATTYLSGALLAVRSAASAPALAPAERRVQEAVAAAARAVRENPGAAPSVEEMAGRAGYSVHHFTRAFRRVTGVTPKEFCVRERLRRARHLLRESDMTVEQVATSLGYADVFFFSRQFKQRTGLPPTAWRKAPGDRPTG